MTAHAEPAAPGADVQAAVSDELWANRDNVADYANRELRPAEVLLLVRHREALSGRVLELGCGAGRLTGYLLELAASVEGADLSPEMVAYCRRAYPRGTFRQADLRDLSGWEAGSFDAVVAGYNLIDVLDDPARQAALDGFHRLLSPGGLLVMSSHNQAAAPLIPTPLQVVPARNPVRLAGNLARLPRRLRNRRRLVAHERVEDGYAILNDVAHDFSILHYYIECDAQARQLADHGFELLECLDLDGRRVEPGEHAAHCHELHYAARRSA